MERLYSGYRDETYQKQRHRHEEWYTEEVNQLIGNQTEISNRKANLDMIVSEYVELDKIKSVLDFGGDRGQFIPDLFSEASRFVYEISGVTTDSNIMVINSIDQSDKMKFDFIMCCHVLEHVSSPVEILNNLKKFSHQGSVFYFEVPSDSPFDFKFKTAFKDKLKGRILRILCSNMFIYNLYYIVSSKLKWLPKFFMMHEHINHFSLKSIKYMLDLNGFEIKYLQEKPMDTGWYKSHIICCLAELKQNT